MSGEYGFYAACLRLIARRTEPDTPEVEAMMEDLFRAADGIEAEGALVVAADRLRGTARALAGVAGLLQVHALPEAVAAGGAGERRVRWMIDVAMEHMAALSIHAEGIADASAPPMRLPLPPPPQG